MGADDEAGARTAATSAATGTTAPTARRSPAETPTAGTADDEAGAATATAAGTGALAGSGRSETSAEHAGTGGSTGPATGPAPGDDNGDGGGNDNGDGDGDGDGDGGERSRRADRPDRAGARITARIDLVALALAMLPFVVGAVALVLGPGGSYLASGDLAAEELAVRDIGRHPVLVGLYSRGDWSHPGPLLYYLLAPFYWLSGRSSIGLDLGTLAINGAAVAGMALVARRRGGLPLMLTTLVGCALLARTLGADFLHDPWVCFVTTLPFGLLVLLSWACTCGERWALPAAVFVASYLAQTHIGFLLLAPPLVLWGAAGLALHTWRPAGAGVTEPEPASGAGAAPRGGLASAGPGSGGGLASGAGEPSDVALVSGASVASGVVQASDVGVASGGGPVSEAGPASVSEVDRASEAEAAARAAQEHGRAAGPRALLGTAGLSALVLAVAWLPPFVDWLTNAPSNVRRIWQWFGDGEEFDTGLHTLSDGWRVMTGQFRLPPEWLIADRHNAFPYGEPATMYENGMPWLLVPVAVGVWSLWRRGHRRRRWNDGTRLAATLGLALVLGIVAIARTVGPAFDYRLRWTWVLPPLALALTAWAGWLAVRDRWPGSERRWLVPAATGLLAAVTAVNVVTAATTGMPYPGETEVVATLTPQVLDALEAEVEGEDADGQVVVDAPFTMGLWWSRGLVLQLERRGIDARIPADQVVALGEHRRFDEGRVHTWLVVVRDQWIETTADQPGMEPIARWSGGPTDAIGAHEVAVFIDTRRSD